jgi:hypothetical protein
MKHDVECVLIPLRELVALGQTLGLAVPQSLTDRVNHMPALPAAKSQTTTLSAAGAPSNATNFAFATPVPVQPGDVLAIETELMYVQAVRDPYTPAGSLQTVQVIRGFGGSPTTAHAAGTAVAFATLTAAQLVKDRINLALWQRADLSTPYAWPYQPTPPSWITKPGQIGGPAGAIATTSEQAGVVIPAAPSTGTPDPAPPASGPAQPYGGA